LNISSKITYLAPAFLPDVPSKLHKQKLMSTANDFAGKGLSAKHGEGKKFVVNGTSNELIMLLPNSHLGDASTPHSI